MGAFHSALSSGSHDHDDPFRRFELSQVQATHCRLLDSVFGTPVPVERYLLDTAEFKAVFTDCAPVGGTFVSLPLDAFAAFALFDDVGKAAGPAVLAALVRAHGRQRVFATAMFGWLPYPGRRSLWGSPH